MRLKPPARAAVVLLFFALAAHTCADEPLGAFSPREVFVGDEVLFSYIEENLPLNELFGQLYDGERSVASFEVPRELIPANLSDISIKSARLIPLQGKENAALCEITFVPWKTGELSIPEIAFTPDGTRHSRAVMVEVSSLAARYEATTLMPNRPPILPPGTLYLLYALVLIVAAACFAAAFAARKVLELRRGPRRIPVKRIRREFARLIKAQRLRIDKNEPSWYAEFSAVARLFFYRMTGERKCLAANARDMARLLEEALSGESSNEAAAAKRLVDALFQIEQIRFGGGGDMWVRVNKINYIEAFEEFVALACASPSSFFGTAKEEKLPLAKNAAAIGKKEKRRAVV